MFWSAGPVEWSPIGNEHAGSVPLTAVDYLRSKPMAPEVPPDEPPPLVLPSSEEEKKKRKQTTDSRLKRLLPILVVILLLIGLIGALLSSFFFPGPSNSRGGSTGPSVAAVSSCFTVAGASDLTSNGTMPLKNMLQAAERSRLCGPTV
jgi:hypothetical protein